MIVEPASTLRGAIAVPGDKSISHRALMLAASSSRPVSIQNLNAGRDVLATISALHELGCDVRSERETTVVTGGSLHDASVTIDCMNSGSTARD